MNKKYRKQFGEFTVEGRKSILELSGENYEIVKIFISQEEDLAFLPTNVTFLVDEESIRKCSFMQNNKFIIVRSCYQNGGAMNSCPIFLFPKI